MAHPLTACLLVGSGGMAGSLARYGLSVAAQRLSVDWPAGTLASNVLGCFAIGLIAEAAARGEGISPEARLLLATGFCGGFTTLSSLVYESAQMLRSGDLFHAVLYLAGTLAVSSGAFLGGLLLVRLLQKSAGV
jgi:CrcB protein